MYIVAYDISDKKRLRIVAKICERYLVRVQKSVFEGNLSKSQLFVLKKELKQEINNEEDSIFIYFIRRTSLNKKIQLGKRVEDAFVII
ncbi:MAG: CRISPR-associated endonuclease Cas2 [Promethearchaeota archaeon]